MKLYIFNPENDMALADGHPGYTPPANIIAYRQQHWELPLQWAEPDDFVWNGKSPLKDLPEDCEIYPWGWSKALVHQLETAGVSRDRMPSSEALDRLRTLSSREHTVSVQHKLGVEAYACHSMEELETLVENLLLEKNSSHPSLLGEDLRVKLLLKSPWSSSGKGLMPTTNPVWRNWAKKIIKLQGCVIIERMLDKALDFAMEFWCEKDGTVRYLGLSVFYTTGKGTYISNFDGTEEEKLEKIDAHLQHIERGEKLENLGELGELGELENLENLGELENLENLGELGELENLGELDTIRNWYLHYLSTIDYAGPVGIDMMITKDGSICPCIEINWRMTMGIVSLMKKR